MARKPKKIGVIDSETDPFKHGRIPKEFCWGVYLESGNGDFIYKSFWGDDCTLQLLDFLTGWNGIIYAHNGGKFDYYYLLNHFQEYDWPVHPSLIKSRISKLKWGPTEYRDSYLILPVALKVTGDKDEIDYQLFEKETREQHKEEILDYLKQDCVGLYKNIRSFIDRFGMGLTLANRSFAEMEKLGIKPHRSSAYRDAQYRDYFFGGRCQCFDSGSFKGKFTYLDINSAYPFAMMEDHFWGTSSDVVEGIPDIDEEKLKRCLMIVNCRSFGAFPRRKKDGSIHFPEDKGDFSVTGWEYVAAMDLDLIDEVTVIRTIIPHETMSFKPFVEKFYKEKLAAEKSGDTQMRLFAKLMMNSGYGRFAMNPDNWSEHALTLCGEGAPDIGEEEKNQNEWELTMRLEDAGFDVFERDVTEDQKRYYNVATSCSITGYVRSMLMRAIDSVDRIYYCDTDSMIFEGSHNVPMGDKLGEWAIEAAGTELHLAGKKLYALKTTDGDWKIASKGVNLTQDPKGTFSNSKDRERAGRKQAASVIKRIAGGGTYQHRNNAYNFSLKGKGRFVERKIRNTAKARKN